MSKITIDREVLERVLESLDRKLIAHATMYLRKALKTNNADVSAMAQPQQEPVAWSVFDKRTGKHWYTHESKNTAQCYAREYSHRESDGSESMVVQPLYTTPPARKPLTDEEINYLGYGVSPLTRKSFARAIEAAHGIKDTP